VDSAAAGLILQVILRGSYNWLEGWHPAELFADSAWRKDSAY
jgi:hypothetical protein